MNLISLTNFSHYSLEKEDKKPDLKCKLLNEELNVDLEVINNMNRKVPVNSNQLFLIFLF
jgi:hypothetical protein